VNTADVPEAELLRHDEKDVNLAWILGRLEYPEFPALPIGVFLDVERPIFEGAVLDQEEAQIAKKGPGDMKELLFGGETWKVG
jgi:2-oxoglutarate ferredoxin oxidoreductase subunit beta